jgi:hypothetical protein
VPDRQRHVVVRADRERLVDEAVARERQQRGEDDLVADPDSRSRSTMRACVRADVIPIPCVPIALP